MLSLGAGLACTIDAEVVAMEIVDTRGVAYFVV